MHCHRSNSGFSEQCGSRLEFRTGFFGRNSFFTQFTFFSATVRSFLGNQTHNDHFKLLQSDGSSLLIGARNVVYNLSLSDLRENEEKRITWDSDEATRRMCLVKGKSEVSQSVFFPRILLSVFPLKAPLSIIGLPNKQRRGVTQRRVDLLGAGANILG